MDKLDKTQRELEGSWWELDHEDNPILGKLQNNDNITLEVIGIEGSSIPMLCHLDSSILKTILGELSSGKYCTLHECSASLQGFGASGLTNVKYTASSFAEGIHSQDLNLEKFSSCRLSYDGLGSWMNIKPFKFSTDEDSKKVEYIYPTSKKIGITSLGITIEFLYYFDGKTNNNGYVYLEAKPYIEIASVKHRSFVEWLEICNDLGMILSIISGQVLACTSFQLKQINFKHNIIHVDEWISIRSKHAFHMFQKYDKSAFQFLISKQSIDSNFDKLINGSFVFVNKNRRILNNFIETLDHEIDEKWKFLKLVQLLEKIHRLLCKGKYMENKLYTDMTNKLKSSCDDLGSRPSTWCKFCCA